MVFPRSYDDWIPPEDRPTWYHDIDAAESEAWRLRFMTDDFSISSLPPSEQQDLDKEWKTTLYKEWMFEWKKRPGQYYIVEWEAINKMWRSDCSPPPGAVMRFAERRPEPLTPAQRIELATTKMITFEAVTGKKYSVNPRRPTTAETSQPRVVHPGINTSRLSTTIPPIQLESETEAEKAAEQVKTEQMEKAKQILATKSTKSAASPPVTPASVEVATDDSQQPPLHASTQPVAYSSIAEAAISLPQSSAITTHPTIPPPFRAWILENLDSESALRGFLVEVSNLAENARKTAVSTGLDWSSLDVQKHESSKVVATAHLDDASHSVQVKMEDQGEQKSLSEYISRNNSFEDDSEPRGVKRKYEGT